jgi:bifunctional oligoribonuclease and PAP phosphatase NrnA
MKPLSEINSLLNNAQNIVITTHQNPDADALGSSLGLQQYLQMLGHTVTVISSTDFPDFLSWMKGAGDILIFEKQADETLAALHASSILFCLDFNIHSRTKNLSPHLQAFKGTKVLIDHHMQPDEDFFDYGISTPGKSSTCEMIYDFIFASNDVYKINKSIAECLYAGTMTDTGSFRYEGTTAQTHSMVADLIKAGVVPNTVHQNIFDTYPERRLRLLGHILCNNLQVFNDQNAALMTLNLAEMDTFDVQNGDTEGIVNYPLSIGNVNFSTFITEKGKDDIRMSFRSKGSIDVNAFARTYFSGGGHLNAAGGKGLETLDATVSRYLEALKEFFKN